MVVIDKTDQHDPRYACQIDDRLGRQRAFDIMRTAMENAKICPSCVASGALYLAVSAWLDSMGKPVDELLELVTAIAGSVQNQFRMSDN